MKLRRFNNVLSVIIIGLGLYIASQFAEAMHGKIGAIRHKDGATFYVELQASSQMTLL